MFGFVPAGVRKRYYENAEDAIVMWCHDIQTPEYADALAAIARGDRAETVNRDASTPTPWCSGSRPAATRPRRRS